MQAPTPEEIQTAKDTGKFTAVLSTDKGDITLQLDGEAAPLHVANFVKLAKNGFYDGVLFHRVEPEFVIQGGDPTATGMGGPGYHIDFEQSPLKHGLGALGMARSQSLNSAGSQFYITLAPTPFLDGNYVVFGQTVGGIDVVQTIVKGDKINKVEIK